MSRNIPTQSSTSRANNMEIGNEDRHDSVQERSGRSSRQKKKSLATSKRNLRRSTRGRGAQGSPDAPSEEDESNGDDEDSSGEQDDDAEDAVEPEVLAPSVEATSTITSESAIDDEPKTKQRLIRRAGHDDGTVAVAAAETSNTTSMLDAGEASDATLSAYPRKQATRRLSNNHGFLTYDDMLEGAGGVGETLVIDSDDDDYTGVNQFYDSDTDDTKMQAFETEAIVGSKGHDEDADVPESLLDADFSAAATETTTYFEDQMARMPEDHSMFLLDVIAASTDLHPNTRKVRFAESTVVHSSSSSDTSEETVELPDIFTETSVNLAGLGHNVDVHSPGSYANSEDGSFWDWTEDEASKYSSPNGSFIANSSTYPLLPAFDTEDDMETDEGSSSGYDTDASGETTDEEMPPPPKAPITPRATLRSYKPPKSRKPFKHAGRPLRSFPIMGSFAVEKEKAIVLTRKYGTIILRRGDPRHTRLVEQSESTSTAQSSPVTPFQSFNADDSDYSEVSRTPITGSMDVMFGGMFGGASNQTYNFGGQVIGPPEAFYPFKVVGEDGRLVDAEEGSYNEDDDDDDDDIEDGLDISNFIKGLSDDEDNGDDTDMGMSYFDESESDGAFGLQSPAPTDTSSIYDPGMFPSQNLYDHFSSPGIVNSFRRQQDHATRLQRLPYDPAQRSAASRPLRSGYNANSLITPSRRRRANHDTGLAKSFSSPVKSRVQKNRVMGPPPRPRLPKRGYF